MIKLSAFADEVSDNFLEQMDFLIAENIKYIEPRFFDNHKNIIDLTSSELKIARKLLTDNGIGISAIGSPIGKVRVDEPFDIHLDKFKHVVELANFLNTKQIRIFSYYAPQGKNVFDFRDEIIARMLRKVDLIKDLDIVMVLENEANLYGQTPDKCVDIVRTVNSPRLRLCYDPANFVAALGTKDNVRTIWPIMKSHVSHIHIKDWKVGAVIGSMPGQGDAQIKLLLEELAKTNYSNFITMEPHLREGGQFGGTTGSELFAQAVKETKRMAQDAGLVIE